MAFKFSFPKRSVKEIDPTLVWVDTLMELDMSETLAQKIVNSILELKDAYVRVPEKLNKLSPTPINVVEGKATISNWLEVLRSFNGGDCVDIVQILLKNWKVSGILDELESLDVLVKFMEGTEPRFFNSDEDNHAYLELGNTVNKVIVDPSFQLIVSKEESGYVARDGKSVDDVLSMERNGERELVLGNMSDIEDMSTAVVGLTTNRDCAISLGFLDGKKDVSPVLKLSKGLNRYYVTFEDERDVGSDVKFPGISEESLAEISRMVRIVKEYVFKSTVVLE